jgi:hypothetical protein
MASFLSFNDFLQLECVAIAALVNEVGNGDTNLKLADQLSRYPQLQGFFDLESSWTQSIRVAIINHLITMEINIPLLIEIIESYRFEVEIDELVEIVRSFDILGAERRLSEYEALLYMKLKAVEPNVSSWQKRCGDRLPVCFFDLVKIFETLSYLSGTIRVLGIIGSQRLIEFVMENDPSLNKNGLMTTLCENGHLSLAKWLRDLGGVDFHLGDSMSFEYACLNGHLSVAQWVHGLGGVDIYKREAYIFVCCQANLSMTQWFIGLDKAYFHILGSLGFRLACSKGHFSVAQWMLDNGGEVDIHFENDCAFRDACSNGHLTIAQWLQEMGVDIHINHDVAFRDACSHGHFAIVQWLYGLGGVDIHAEDDFAFRYACEQNHLLIAKWLYDLGEINIHIDNDAIFRRSCCFGL